MSTQILTVGRDWLKTMKDKNQAKLDTMTIQSWLKELNVDTIIAGSETIPAVPAKSPDWATDLRNYLVSIVKMQPGDVKSTILGISSDLDVLIKEIIAEIGSTVAPPADATPSQTAALANFSKIKAICEKYPNNPNMVSVRTYVDEAVGDVNKIGSEAVELEKEKM